MNKTIYTESIDTLLDWSDCHPEPSALQQVVIEGIWEQYQAYEHETNKTIAAEIVRLGLIELAVLEGNHINEGDVCRV